MHFVELVVYIFFPIFLAFLLREKKYRDVAFLAVAFLYATAFEHINMAITQTYEYIEYGFGFWGLPLYIPLVWALLLYHAYVLLRDFLSRTHKKKNQTLMAVWGAFLGSLYVLTYDLVIDVIAVQRGWWTRYLTSSQEWFGVSFENFFGWFLVAFFFLLFALLLRHVKKAWKAGAIFGGALLMQTFFVASPYLISGLDVHCLTPSSFSTFVVMILLALLGVAYFLRHVYKRRRDISLSRKLLMYLFALVHFGSLAYVVIMKYPTGLVWLSLVISLLYGFFVLQASPKD